MEEQIKWYEHADKRICKYWLQIESCRKCLFEVLCRLENQKDLQHKKEQWTEY